MARSTGTMVGSKDTLSALWWSLHAVLCILIVSVAGPASASDAQLTTELLTALNDVILEEDARKVLEPYMEDLKKLDATVVEKVVFKQWWNLAQDMVAKSHLQHVDLSVSVRKAVRSLKDEADELLRTLNPKYGQAQQVAPAFQWAQNDTCVFLTVKFTVRWNAPGALEVTDPTVHMEGNIFNFTGLGKHSNNKYKYQLALKLFDNLSPIDSTWNTASVGKLSVTLRKKWPRKWPRLLQDKKMKIGNMHVWMETQDRLNGQLGGMSTVSHSPITCRDMGKLYCSVTDTCKMPANCSQCIGKTEPAEDQHICAGAPTQRATLSFKDVDMDRDEYGGVIKVTKEKHDFESDTFAVYWGRDSHYKLDVEEGSGQENAKASLIGEAQAVSYGDCHVNLELNTKKPEQATHFLVFSKNAYGEYNTPYSLPIRDAYLPLAIIKSVSFEDEDGDRNEIKGDLSIEKPDDDSSIDKYAIYWGKSDTHRIDARRKNMTHLADFDKSQKSYWIGESTKIPEHATHLLLYSKNEHGEHPTPVAVKIVDNLKPCQQPADEDCPGGVSHRTTDGGARILSVERAKAHNSLVAYTLYWGRKPCEEGAESAQNGHIKYLAAEGSLDYELPANVEVPDGTTHILAFSQNKRGESKFCVSQSFAWEPRKAATEETGADKAEESSGAGDNKPETAEL